MLKLTALWNETSKHEAESGLLIYNKSKLSSFFGILNTCNLNTQPILDRIRWIFWGEKETFWMALELLSLPYVFENNYGAAAGYKKNHSTSHTISIRV